MLEDGQLNGYELMQENMPRPRPRPRQHIFSAVKVTTAKPVEMTSTAVAVEAPVEMTSTAVAVEALLE